jgi:hypothetical protein
MKLTPLSVAACLALASCGDLGLGTETGSSGGGTSSGTTAASSSSGTTTSASTSTTGVSCNTDSQSGITLCEEVTACPGVDVDQGAFAGCGFRLHGPAKLDLECLCNGESLCPIGVPATCADAQQLLNQQGGALSVCQQVDQGSCLDVVDAGSSAPSSCDKACESQCQSDPGCISLCGC